MPERMDLSFASLADISARIRQGGLSPVALVEHCLRRIDALQPTLNAFITVTADLARDQARTAEGEIRAGRWRGPLHGVPVAVKDFYDTAGIRTTAGFDRFASRVPSRDADMVAKLRDAGAVLVGKTNMHRLGMGTTSLESHFGPVVNPWSARHVAGGSSGGSAAAVAAGLCFATIDTDAVGSGRLPAAICGVTCLKPTFGRLSTKGILAGETTDPTILVLSHACLTARSVEDVTLVYDVLTDAPTGAAPAARHRAIDPPPARRVGVVSNFTASSDARAAFQGVVERLAMMGIETREVRVPFEGASFDVQNIERDRAAIDARLFGDVDAIVLPTLTASTPTVDDARGNEMAVSADNTFFCNYYGLPAISVPAGMNEDGLPFGVQFVGPQGGDDSVLALADAYLRRAGWQYAPPPMVSIEVD
jgi:aspartyl-tRNA(Asn)/glutamyl-tRNA(Gln) amidotransferase subunit A